jgi:protease YdgD
LDWYAHHVLPRSFAFHLFGFAGALALLTATSSLAGAQLRAEDALTAPAPTRVNVEEVPWNSVGKLQAVAGSLRKTCTAVLVRPQTVLTSAHCIFNGRTRSYFLPSSVHFVAGLQGGRMASAATGSRLTTAPSFDPVNPIKTVGSDWALVELAVAVDGAVGPLPLNAGLPRIGATIMMGGYAILNPNVMTADLECKVIGYGIDDHGGRLVFHDCANQRGVSGAPLLLKSDQGWSVVGVNAGKIDPTVGFAVATKQIEPYVPP